MLPIVSVLIVIALAGTPVIKLVCDLSCQTESRALEPAEMSCHDSRDGSRQVIKGTPDICPRAVTAGPFLIEATYQTLSAASGLPAATAASSARLDHLRHKDDAFLLRGDSGPPRTTTISVLRI